mgnify:CR=1 FL=1
MDYSRKISERLWNMPDKGELESHREETFIDDIIQKSHIEKELLSIIKTAQPDLLQPCRFLHFMSFLCAPNHFGKHFLENSQREGQFDRDNIIAGKGD